MGEASSVASARSWTLTSHLFPGRRSMPRRPGQGESLGRRKDCFEKGSQVQFCIEMFNLQNCGAKIAFEMSIKDEMLLQYRHVNVRSLQLGPSAMLTSSSDKRHFISTLMNKCKTFHTVVLHLCRLALI